MEFGASSKSWCSNFINNKTYFQNQNEEQIITNYQNTESNSKDQKTRKKVIHKKIIQKPQQIRIKTEEEDLDESALNRTNSDSRCKLNHNLH